jgi:UDPglucose--hexose-1-phosphate uridylyltransferase
MIIDGRCRTYYRRSHRKADGRELLLFGYAPHQGEALAEFDTPVSTGSELRRHPLLDSWAIYSPHRQHRTFKPSAAADPLAPATPGGPPTEIPFEDFELAVFGNRFPSLHPDSPEPDVAPWSTGRAAGACEVVVYAPDREGSLATLSQERRILLIEAWIDRYAAHFEAGAAYVLPFENRGDAVGVTLAHPHGQLYAFPFVPKPQASAAAAFAQGYDLEDDRTSWGADFAIAEAGGVRAYAPPFGRFPYETWLSCERRVAGPWEMSGEEIEGLAELLGEMTRRYDALFDAPMPLMMNVQAAPREAAEGFQFTVQFFPIMRSAGRLKYLAGVEQSTNVFTVDIDPRAAAEALRTL